MELHWMKVYPGNLLMKAAGLSPEDRGRYYEAVFHLWSTPALSRSELEERIGTISASLLSRFNSRNDGKIGLDWVDAERIIQIAAATKNSLNRKGKKKVSTGISTGKTSGMTSGGTTPVPVPDVVPVPEKREVQEGGKSGPRKAKDVNEIFFDEARITPLEAATANPSLAHHDADWLYYTEAISTYSATKNIKRTRAGWLATYRQFINSDAEAGRLRKRKSNNGAAWNPRA